jgi:hypothetical protein
VASEETMGEETFARKSVKIREVTPSFSRVIELGRLDGRPSANDTNIGKNIVVAGRFDPDLSVGEYSAGGARV